MNKLNFKCIITILILISSIAQAELMEDFDTLGGNNVLLEKVKDLNPDTKVSIVQDRVVSRRNRFEFSSEFANVVGGDSYNKSNNLGLNLNYHINPHWSVGLKYSKSFNKLTNEGEYIVDLAEKNNGGVIPYIDYSKQSTMLLVDFYPIYGKMNLYDLGILHFDTYLLGGYGTVDLRSGQTSTYTGGLGFGLWFSQHLTSRLEARYQNYKADDKSGGKQNINTTVLSVQIGYLL